jgi:hypothetical protein
VILPIKMANTGLMLWASIRKIPLGGIGNAINHINLQQAALSAGVFLVGTLVLESASLALASTLLAERQPRYFYWLRIFAESRSFFYLLPGAAAAEGMAGCATNQWTREWGTVGSMIALFGGLFRVVIYLMSFLWLGMVARPGAKSEQEKRLAFLLLGFVLAHIIPAGAIGYSRYAMPVDPIVGIIAALAGQQMFEEIKNRSRGQG